MHVGPCIVLNAHFVGTTKFGRVRGVVNRNLFPEFREVWSVGPVIPCGYMHQSFTDTLKSGFSTTSPCFPVLMFFLFTALPVDQVRAFCTTYKCPTSRGGSLRQHGLLVSFLAIRTFRTLLLMALSLMSISNGTILLYIYVLICNRVQ